jgi:hypothetical protein
MEGTPDKRAHLPPDLRMATQFLTARDMRRQVPRMSKVEKMLSDIPVERTLDWVARMIAPTFRGRVEARAHEVQVARSQFTQSPGEMRALDLVLTRQRQLFAPHVLLYLGRLAVLHGSPRPAGDYESQQQVARYERILLDAMLIAAHHSGSRRRADRTDAVGVDERDPAPAREATPADGSSDQAASASGTQDNDPRGDDVVTAMDLELAANIMANRKPFPASTFDRSERRWVEIPAEDDDPAAVDLAAEFEAATGTSFADLRMVGVVLWARTAAGESPHIGRNHLDGLGMGADRARAVLRLISGDLATLRAEARKAGPSEYESSLFSRFPLVECDDGSFIIMNEAMLVERTLGWLPRHDLDALAYNGGPEGRRRAASAVTYLRSTTERHAVETLQALTDVHPEPGVMYGAKEIQGAYGSKDLNADVAIVGSDSVVVAEISSRTVMRGTAAGSSSKDFLKDLNHGVLDKVGQIDSTINDIRDDLSALTGDTSAPSPQRIWPVLVTTEGWPITPRMTKRVRRLLESNNLLQGAQVKPLNIIDIEGLEAAEAVIERTGLSLDSLFEEHQASLLSLNGFRDWLIDRYAPVRPTERIMNRWDRTFAPALAALDATEELQARARTEQQQSRKNGEIASDDAPNS